MSNVIKTPLIPLCWYSILRPAVGLALSVLLLFAGQGEVQAVELNILAAGATESIIRDMVGTFEKESGHTIRLTYAPVGALRNKIYAGEPADLTIVTPVIIEQLQAKGLVRPDTTVPLGKVGGGIAVRKGAPHPAIGTPEELKQALLAATEIYHADPKIATAGAYFLQVVDRLGIRDDVRKKGWTAGDGKASMELMAKSTANAIGLTQISEILSVQEIVLVGPYPGSLQNMTTYTGVLFKRTPHPEAAQAFLSFLMSPPVQAGLRRRDTSLHVEKKASLDCPGPSRRGRAEEP